MKNFATDVGVFGFPSANAGEKAPVLGGGDLAVLLNDSDAAKTGMKLLAESEHRATSAASQRLVVPVAAQGLRLVPVHQPGHQGLRPGGQERLTTLLFDGSDQMPGEVGAGSFWKQVTSWITGQQDLDAAP